MAISYNKVDIRGNALEPIFGELLFLNPTIKDSLVDFKDNIKAGTILTNNYNSVVAQAYTSGVEITPVKVMYYDEFDMDTLRPTRFNSTMKSGAWNTASSEFEKLVLGYIGLKIALDAERMFWNGSTTATKTAVATAGTASYTSRELTYVSGSTSNLIDGVVTKLITGASTVKVAGTTITSSNIEAEYKKVYQSILPVVLRGSEKPYIYAPYSHEQFINVFNSSATYRDIFSADINAGKYFYNGVEIKFVPLPENVMVAGLPSRFLWLTDLMSDINYLQVDKIANNQDKLFYKAVFTEYAYVAQTEYAVLYI
jgi:hypothetical protein